jgi:hypothetical protein
MRPETDSGEMNIMNMMYEKKDEGQHAKIRAAIAKKQEEQKQKVEILDDGQRVKAYINQQKPVLWEELKSSIRDLCSAHPDAVELLEKDDYHLLVRSRDSDHKSIVAFENNHRFIVTYFYMTGKGWGQSEVYLGDLRCTLNEEGVARLSPHPQFYWTPEHLAFLIVFRIVSQEKFVNPDA